MQRIINYYRLLNILSLDVAIGAIISAFFLTRVYNVTVTYYGLLCLGLSVWLIYTADHLVDAKLIKTEASTQRHRFHQRHFNAILILSGLVSLTILVLLFYIYTPLLYLGLVLGALVLIYFLIQRQLGFMKEVLGAGLYCLGVMLPVIAFSKDSYYSLLSIPFILFFNIVLINLILFSWFDRDKDMKDNHTSLVVSLGPKVGRIVLTILFVIQPTIAAYVYNSGIYYDLLIIFGLMYVVLLVIFLMAKWFATEDKYRLVGDAIFIIPLLHLLL